MYHMYVFISCNAKYKYILHAKPAYKTLSGRLKLDER